MRIFPATVQRKCPHGPVCNRTSRYQGLICLLWCLLTVASARAGDNGWAIFSAWSFGITFDAWLSHWRHS